MLSPHELATLHLIARAPGQVDVNRPEFEALTVQKLVRMSFRKDRPEQPSVTARGLWLLSRLGLTDQERQIPIPRPHDVPRRAWIPERSESSAKVS